jgi:hypothetical protein
VVFEVAKPLPIKVVIDNVFTGQPLSHVISQFTGITEPISREKLLLYCILLIAAITIGSAIISITVAN